MTSVNPKPLIITGHGENGFISLLRQKNNVNVNINDSRIENTKNKYNSSKDFDEFLIFNASKITFSPYFIKDILFNTDGSKKWKSSMDYVNEEERELEQINQRYNLKKLEREKEKEQEKEQQIDRERQININNVNRYNKLSAVEKIADDNIPSVYNLFSVGGGIFNTQKYEDKYLKYKKKYLDLKNKY